MWTKEKIFRNPDWQIWQVPPDESHTYSHSKFYTDEFLTARDAETHWVVQSVPTFAPGDRERVGDRVIECPLCGGSGQLSLLATGRDTGIELLRTVRCQCVPVKMIGERLKRFPERFKSAWLTTAQPSALSRMSLAKQQALINLLKTFPHSSYVFWGDPGTGKTHFASMLYNQAVAEWAFGCKQIECAVWRVNLPTLLDQFVTKSTNLDAPAPDLTVRQILNRVREGQKPSLFLEEADKFRGSEYRLNKLFEFADCVYENGGQIVMTSNASPDALCRSWGTSFGETILRRIGREPDGKTVHFQAE